MPIKGFLSSDEAANVVGFNELLKKHGINPKNKPDYESVGLLASEIFEPLTEFGFNNPSNFRGRKSIAKRINHFEQNRMKDNHKAFLDELRQRAEPLKQKFQRELNQEELDFISAFEKSWSGKNLRSGRGMDHVNTEPEKMVRLFGVEGANRLLGLANNPQVFNPENKGFTIQGLINQAIQNGGNIDKVIQDNVRKIEKRLRGTIDWFKNPKNQDPGGLGDIARKTLDLIDNPQNLQMFDQYKAKDLNPSSQLRTDFRLQPLLGGQTRNTGIFPFTGSTGVGSVPGTTGTTGTTTQGTPGTGGTVGTAGTTGIPFGGMNSGSLNYSQRRLPSFARQRAIQRFINF